MALCKTGYLFLNIGSSRDAILSVKNADHKSSYLLFTQALMGKPGTIHIWDIWDFLEE